MAEHSLGSRRPALFDGMASRYDERFSDRLPAHWLRAAVRDRLTPLLKVPSRILEVGCGTGADAIWLAEQGHEVIATDASQEMLNEAERKITSAGLKQSIRLDQLDLAIRGALREHAAPPVDLVLANFGVLNCVQRPRDFVAEAADSLRPGGHLALTVMGRFCLWESLRYLLAADPEKLARRWRGRASFDDGPGGAEIWYHSPGSLTAPGLPGLERTGLYGIGILVPPSYLFGLCERWPRLFGNFAQVERLVAGLWPFPFFADHYLILLKRVAGVDSDAMATGDSS
jgi:SAM-dependent methyltransferase